LNEEIRQQSKLKFGVCNGLDQGGWWVFQDDSIGGSWGQYGGFI